MQVQSLAELAEAQIQEWIATAVLRPGQQLKEEDIAQRLSISRPPVREAFKILEAKGLVMRKPRCGVFVTEVTRKDIWEIYILKAVLYEMAADLAVPAISESQIDQLDEMVRRMETRVRRKRPDIVGYQNIHQAYHRLILDVAGNGRLKAFAVTLHEQVRRLSYRTLQDTDHLHASLAYHKKIVQAFRDGNRAAAKRLMRTHVLEALKVYDHVRVSDAEAAGPPDTGGIDGTKRPSSRSVDGETATP